MDDFREDLTTPGGTSEFQGPEGLLFTGDFIRSLSPEQVEAIGQAALSFGVEIRPIQSIEHELDENIRGVKRDTSGTVLVSIQRDEKEAESATLDLSELEPQEIVRRYRDIEAADDEGFDSFDNLSEGFLKGFKKLIESNPEMATETMRLLERGESKERKLAAILIYRLAAASSEIMLIWENLLGDIDGEIREEARQSVDIGLKNDFISLEQTLQLVRVYLRGPRNQ